MKREQTITATETRTEVGRHDLRKALRKAGLTAEEERVIRMRAGLAEPAGAALSFRGGDSEEMAAKLAIMEAEALAHVRPAASPARDGRALKRAIVDGLKKI